MSLISVIHKANSFPFEKDSEALRNVHPSTGLPFIVDDTIVGLIPPHVSLHLNQEPNVFMITESFVKLNPQLKTPEDRSKAVSKVLQSFRDQEIFSCLKGWRNEEFPVFGTGDQGLLFQVERSAVGLLGVRAAGCHLNGFVRAESGIKMWVARRSYTKQTYPGQLDNTVGGKLPFRFLKLIE